MTTAPGLNPEAGADEGRQTATSGAKDTRATTPPKWAGVSHELDTLTDLAVTTTPWWEVRVEPKLVLDRDTWGCRVWTGYRGPRGYGRVGLPMSIAPKPSGGSGRMVLVHRAALVRHLGGPLPFGLTVDHLCGNPACANAEDGHLEAVPVRINTARGSGVNQAGVAARLATGLCPRGHSGAWKRAPEWPDSWTCAECHRQNNARRNATVSAAYKGLNLDRATYRALFGQSVTTAQNVLAAIALGRDPASIIAGARIALEASEREGVLAWLESLARGAEEC